MRLRRLTLQNFRNIPLTQLALTGRLQFFVGANGQGKTNLLEAVGCLTALRSFRTADHKLLIAHGQAEAAIAGTLEHERCGWRRPRGFRRAAACGRCCWPTAGAGYRHGTAGRNPRQRVGGFYVAGGAFAPAESGE